ncbi:SDR family NAD(P)-dependent oxidoreductase [Roseivirga sp. BDSF3-8]|uniref:SDR family NAD(P)-dependent oxidoreductase n=1 Tax=Roseivirga sp. BDSF3-8 TaxID=3241598 RepID=UPI003531C5FC
MTLEGTKWLIAGGAGAVGEGVVRRLLRHDATVLVPVRDAKKGEWLRTHLEQQSVSTSRLLIQQAEFDEPEVAAEFSETIRKDHADIDAAVASIGGWWQGAPIHQTSWMDWQQVLRNNLSAHFLFMKAVYPILAERKSGMYVMINGGASEYPVPDSGAVSVMASAQQMMARVMAAENKHPSTLRIYSLVLMTPVVTRVNERDAHPDWVTASQVGEYLATMYHGKTNNRDEAVHFLHNRQDIRGHS